MSAQVFTLTAILLLTILANVAESQNSRSCGCPKRPRRSTEDATEDSLLVGDMILTGEAKELFFNEDPDNDEKFRAGSLYGPHIWPDGLVRYYVPPNFDAEDSAVIRSALNDLTRRTDNCVRFEQIQNPSTSSGSYVYITTGHGCSSYIGRYGDNRSQNLSLDAGCWGESTIQHEFMHALGFYHEQNRPDRDDKVVVDWDRIETKNCRNYYKCRHCRVFTDYNIQSVMHYGSYGFSCDDDPHVMFTKGPNGEKNKFSRSNKLQDSDVFNIKSMYRC